MSQMLYKHPGKHKLHGDMFDYIIVEEDEIEDTIAKGWSLTTTEAKSFVNEDMDLRDPAVENTPPTRAEMETKAKELGIRFPANTKDATLLKKINEKLDELD